jgi:hypothetical protein
MADNPVTCGIPVCQSVKDRGEPYWSMTAYYMSGKGGGGKAKCFGDSLTCSDGKRYDDTSLSKQFTSKVTGIGPGEGPGGLQPPCLSDPCPTCFSFAGLGFNSNLPGLRLGVGTPWAYAAGQIQTSPSVGPNFDAVGLGPGKSSLLEPDSTNCNPLVTPCAFKSFAFLTLLFDICRLIIGFLYSIQEFHRSYRNGEDDG